MGTDELERGTGRATNINRAGRMVLHPLAEVGIGVFVSVRISRQPAHDGRPGLLQKGPVPEEAG